MTLSKPIKPIFWDLVECGHPDLIPVNLRIQLCYSLVTPHYDYADIIWGGCGSVNSEKLQITWTGGGVFLILINK